MYKNVYYKTNNLTNDAENTAEKKKKKNYRFNVVEENKNLIDVNHITEIFKYECRICH